MYSIRPPEVIHTTLWEFDARLLGGWQLGDRCVYTKNGRDVNAKIHFIGYLGGHSGLFAGIEFDEPVGLATGTYQGIPLFSTRLNRAGFVKLAVLRRPPDAPPPRRPSLSSLTAPLVSNASSGFHSSRESTAPPPRAPTARTVDRESNLDGRRDDMPDLPIRRVLSVRRSPPLPPIPADTTKALRGPGLQVERESCNVFVRNLDRHISEENVKILFTAFGAIKSCRVIKNVDGTCKGFAFVEFSSLPSARDAVFCLHSSTPSFNSKPLHVAFSRDKDDEDGLNLFVSNIDYNITEEALMLIFLEYGPVNYVKIFTNGNGRSKGSGIVSFENEIDGVMAMTGLHGKVIARRPLRVEQARKNNNNNNSPTHTDSSASDATVNRPQSQRNQRVSTAAQNQNHSPVECAVCLEEKPNRVFSCGHIACERSVVFRCATQLADCHICRQKITSRMPIFF